MKELGLGRGMSCNAIFHSPPHREFWGPSSQIKALQTPEPQKGRAKRSSRHHTLLSSRCRIRRPRLRRARTCQRSPRSVTVSRSRRSLFGPSFPRLGRHCSSSRQLSLISPPISFTHSSFFLSNDSFTLQEVLSGN